MRKLLQQTISGLVISLSLLPFVVQAQGFNANSSGLSQTGTAVFGTLNEGDLNIATFIGRYIVTPVVGLLGLIFFCLMIYAGFLWMTAQGDDKKIASAKGILSSAVVGTIIVLAAYVITNFVFSALAPASGA